MRGTTPPRHVASAFTVACIVVSLIGLLVPPALVAIPPLLDYPNHLARLHVLSEALIKGRDSPFYAVHLSGTWLNVAKDWLGVALSYAIPTGQAGSVLVGLAVLLPPTGAIVLNRTIFRTWHWWQIAFALFAWNSSLVVGLLSFQIGVGIALLAAAADAAWQSRSGSAARFISRMAIAALLLAVHPFATALYAALLAGLVAGAAIPPGGVRVWLRDRGLDVATAGLACTIPVVVYVAFTHLPIGGIIPPEALNRSEDVGLAIRLFRIFAPLLAPIWSYSIGLDILSLMPLLIIAGAVILSGAGFRGHVGLLAVLIALTVLTLVVPFYFLGNGATNMRIGSLLGLILMAACIPAPGFASSRAARNSLAITLTLVVGLRTGMICQIWMGSRADTQAVIAALSHAERGSRVLPVEHTPSVDGANRPPWHRAGIGHQPLYWHLATLAVSERSAFVPTLFATPGKQTIVVRPPWDALAVHEPFLSTIQNLALADRNEEALATEPRLYGYRYLRRWQQTFDYVLVLNADRPDRFGPAPRLSSLELVADEGFAQLWRVIRPTGRGE